MDRLTLAIPTNRGLAAVEENLLNVIRISGKKKCKLVVSDNSGDGEKQQRLSKILGDAYHLSGEAEGAGNWAFALSKVQTDFVGFVADDDWLVDLPEADPKIVPNDYVCMMPQVLISAPNLGPYSYKNFNLNQESPFARLELYAVQSAGANSILYGFWRKDLLENMYRISLKHPCPAGYQDWVISEAMLAEGKVLSLGSLLYCYNNNNWFGPQDAIKGELQQLLRRADLPPALADLDGYLRIIDLVCFFARSEGYRLPLEARMEILSDRLSQLSSSLEIDLLGKVVNAALNAIEKVSEEAKQRYSRYIEQSVDHAVLDSLELW